MNIFEFRERISPSLKRKKKEERSKENNNEKIKEAADILKDVGLYNIQQELELIASKNVSKMITDKELTDSIWLAKKRLKYGYLAATKQNKSKDFHIPSPEDYESKSGLLEEFVEHPVTFVSISNAVWYDYMRLIKKFREQSVDNPTNVTNYADKFNLKIDHLNKLILRSIGTASIYNKYKNINNQGDKDVSK